MCEGFVSIDYDKEVQGNEFFILLFLLLILYIYKNIF